jgi:hypothetical protein
LKKFYEEKLSEKDYLIDQEKRRVLEKEKSNTNLE